uniref:Filament-like plant protein n=1 Tax=Leersia perrieri TaxID=77586 RepID=A0A0D9WZ91_9ORYZ
MDRRSWLWRRRSTEKSPAVAEIDSSASSPSERLSDEQDTSKSSPNSIQSPEIASKEAQDDNVKVKVLSERLSSAVLDIRAKDDLVKQHSKVAEEAVLGWEKAEKEIASLKTQLNAATVKNSTLEDRIVHLDGALKECVRQLRRAKEEQDQNVQDALAHQSRQWESEKTDLELQIVEFKAKLEAKSEFSVNTTDNDASSRLASLEKENSALKVQLLTKSEELELRTIEKELNRRAAETASKQQLESIKKIAKLEAECRKLQANARKPSFSIELRRAPSSVCTESVTDYQSDCSDSWASALITELDQFKNDKSSTRSASITAADIGIMDDFLEMEKLALANTPSKGEVEDASGQLVKLEEKIKKLTTEKADREKALHEAQRELRNTCHRTMVAEEKSVELQRLLNLVKGEKHSMETEMEVIENKRTELEGKLELAHAEIASLMDRGRILEERLESEKALTLEVATKYHKMDALEAERKELHVQLEASQSEARKLSDKITSLERKLEEKASSARLGAKCHGIEALEEKNKGIEHDLESAREEITSLQKNVSNLELKIQEEKALSAKLATRSRDLEALDVQTNELRSQLKSANSEIASLNEKVKVLEAVLENHKPLTAGLESQLKLAQAETMRLKDNVSSLEKKLESQKNLSSAYITALDASEAQKNKFVSRFELKEAEVEELHRKIRLLEEQICKEKAQSSELGVQCENLKEQFSSRALSQPMKPMANKELHIKKEKELARAAGKLADCQKTIASLNRQLKSLADFDEFVPGFENDSITGESWEDGDLKPFDSASNYAAQLGCLAVK